MPNKGAFRYFLVFSKRLDTLFNFIRVEYNCEMSMMSCKNRLQQNIVCTNHRNVHLLGIFVNGYCRYIYLKQVCIYIYSNFYQKYRINTHFSICHVQYSAIIGFCRTPSICFLTFFGRNKDCYS